MLVSREWLSQYVRLDMPLEELTERLTMSGLNLEGVQPFGDDTVIDLEVTSNRPDCLGHLGVAREISVLFDRPLHVPAAQPVAVSEPVGRAVAVRIECPDLCGQYHARVIRGVRVGPSPQWLQRRLQAVGVACINNVVDITNYVLLECGQPLHAFDYDRLRGREIVVRRARPAETIRAINQRDYTLTPEMCVIADAERPVAVAGVMGGLDTEITAATRNVLIEAAAFAPLAIRNTARKLDLHSPSSYRFERALDLNGPDWASRRCCELILEVAGGELLEGSVTAGETPPKSGPVIVLRHARFQKVLGIDIPMDVVARVLQQLGLQPAAPVQAAASTWIAPTFRRDLTREIDLIEEVARIYGYDKFPHDVVVPLCASAKSQRERVIDRIGDTLAALGFYEAVTLSFTTEEERQWFQPRGELPVLAVEHSSRKQENLLRQSLIPSLLAARRGNERHGNFQAQLFEIAKVFWKADPSRPETETEPWMVGLVTGRSFHELKGVVETLVQRIAPRAELSVRESDVAQFTPGRGAEVLLDGHFWGWMGELARSVAETIDLRDTVCVAELALAPLEALANFVPRVAPLPEFPAIVRDLNLVLDEGVAWASLERVVRQSAGPLLEAVAFSGQYRGRQIGEQQKSYLLTLTFRAPDRTLTSDEVDAAQRGIIAAVERELGGKLRG
jgi:phenylalanyl-tRNA synthetase beta chain